MALTEHEERVYALLLCGAGVKDIARTLHRRTGSTHNTIQAIYAKRGVRSQTQLIAQDSDGRRPEAEAEGNQGLAPLTPRVAQVAALTATGHTRAQVARELGTSADTVKKQLTRAYGQLGIGRRAELAALCAGQTPFSWDHLRPQVEAGWDG